MPRTRTYLDHAATTPLRPEAREAMAEGFAIWANPSSPHAEGRKAREALESGRERVKAALGWEGEVIFTSGASEALEIALQRGEAGRRIVSAIEHDAVFRAAGDAEVLPMNGGWIIDPGPLVEMLGKGPRAVVAIQHVNPETGTIQPIDSFADIVQRDDGLLLVDCAQSAGKLELPRSADMAVVSAHKVGGPIGVGALLVRDYALLKPTGGQERGYRGGTENLPGILGFAVALEAGGTEAWQTDAAERDAFRKRLAQTGTVLGGQSTAPHIVSVAHKELSANALLIRLDAMGFAVSAGSACSSGTLKGSRVLEAFDVDRPVAERTIRVSLGWNTTKEDLAAFIGAWESLA